MTKTILITGAGGVGKTTIAAAIGVNIAIEHIELRAFGRYCGCDLFRGGCVRDQPIQPGVSTRDRIERYDVSMLFFDSGRCRLRAVSSRQGSSNGSDPGAEVSVT